MLPPPATVSMGLVHGMLSGVKARGEPLEVFLADAAIAPELLELPGARVAAAQYIALFRALIEHRRDEGLGFFSRPFKYGSFAMIVRSGQSAPDLGTAIRRIAHTFQLLQDDVTLECLREVTEAGEQIGLALRFATRAAGEQIFLHEMLLRVFWRLLAWLAGGKLPCTRFDFAFAASPHIARDDKVFPAPTRFGQSQTAFWFDAARLKHRISRDASALRVFLSETQINIILPRRESDLTSARVRSHLQQTHPAWPDLAETARALHVSTSTLQRRLAAEKTTFQTIKDELRRDFAIVCLNARNMTLDNLAQELGFTDSAAFQRAFKGWTGSAPGTYRRGRKLDDGVG